VLPPLRRSFGQLSTIDDLLKDCDPDSKTIDLGQWTEEGKSLEIT